MLNRPLLINIYPFFLGINLTIILKSKVSEEIKTFDIALEIVSLCGIYSFSINTIISLSFWFYNKSGPIMPTNYQTFLTTFTNGTLLYHEEFSHGNDRITYSIFILAFLNAFLSIIQGTFQTLFIMECLKRFAHEIKTLIQKPGRELVTFLLSMFSSYSSHKILV